MNQLNFTWMINEYSVLLLGFEVINFGIEIFSVLLFSSDFYFHHLEVEHERKESWKQVLFDK